MGKKFLLRTFGCQMNAADAEVAMGILQQAEGEYVYADSHVDADIVIMNTCSVRDHAEQRVFGLLRTLQRQKKTNPALLIGIIGCMAVEYKERLFEEYPYVDFICSNKDLDRLPGLIEDARSKKQGMAFTDEGYGFDGGLAAIRRDGVRALVPIMHGCDNFCSYCIVPYVRGREVSRPLEAILEELRHLRDAGFKHIMFLGQNVNSYGKGLDAEIDFVRLLDAATRIDGIELIEFMTSHPKDLSPDLIACVADNDKLSSHIHLPVQSGSNAMLARMNRGYTCEEYLAKVRMFQKRVAQPSVTTDIIVGFPGETEEDFMATKRLIEDVPFDNAFIFKYSEREGTRACDFSDDVPDAEKRRRNQILLETQEEMTRQQHAKLIGETFRVLISQESKKQKDQFAGVSWNDKMVVFDKGDRHISDIVSVRFVGCAANTFQGEVLG